MDIQGLINEYTEWLKKEIRFEKIGEYYEISTPFLDSNNDYIQFYVRMDGDVIYFTDDGFTVNRLSLNGIEMNGKRKRAITGIVNQYGVEIDGDTLITKADIRNFPQKKHTYIQAIMKLNDLYMATHSRNASDFTEDIQQYFGFNEIYYTENVQFTGTSGFSHNYDFLIQRSKKRPERLCKVMNNPNKSNTSSILFAWNDTKPYRREDSKLIVFLNDRDRIGKGVEEAFLNYDAKVVKWSEKDRNENIDYLSA